MKERQLPRDDAEPTLRLHCGTKTADSYLNIARIEALVRKRFSQS